MGECYYLVYDPSLSHVGLGQEWNARTFEGCEKTT